MSLLQPSHGTGSSTPPHASFWDRLVGAALLTFLALATIGWCSLLALALWKALLWMLVGVS